MGIVVGKVLSPTDEQNRTIGIIDSEGVTRIGYNAEGLRKSYEDKMNNLTQFDYTNGKITHICNALRQDIWITYDKSGNMINLQYAYTDIRKWRHNRNKF